MSKIVLTLSKIRKTFDFIPDSPTHGYYSGDWKIERHEEFELYIHAPKKHIDPSQLTNFNAFLDNHILIREQIDAKMTAILKQRKGKKWKKALERPMNFSIISVMSGGKDFEGNACNYDIEVISSRYYKVFFQKIAVDIIAYIKQGEIIEIIDEI